MTLPKSGDFVRALSDVQHPSKKKKKVFSKGELGEVVALVGHRDNEPLYTVTFEDEEYQAIESELKVVSVSEALFD